MSIIFRGKSLVAHHNAADTSFLVVTFIGAFHENEAESVYLMKEVVERDHIACVGLTARQRNLYISDEIEEIAAKVKALRVPGQKLIMLGQSIGGYAAIKFANLFGADYSVAFSPTFSLDVSDLGLQESQQEERELLEKGLRFHHVPREIIRPGMRPGPEDCAAPILFVYDVLNEVDNYAARCYEGLFPSARFVRARNIGHAVLNRVGSKPFLRDLSANLLRSNLDGAQAVLRRFTRSNELYVADLLLRIARWRPSMVNVALRTSRAVENIPPETRYRHLFNTVVAYEFAIRGDVAAATAHLRETYPRFFPAVHARSETFLVISWFGDVLTYDRGTAEAVLRPGTLYIDGASSVVLDLRGSKPRAIMRPSEGGQTVVLDRSSAERHGSDFEVVQEDGSAFVSFRRGGLYLRAVRRGTPVFDRERARAYEQFVIIPVTDPEPERNAPSGNHRVEEGSHRDWIDSVASTVQSVGGRAANPEARTDTVRKAAFRAFIRFFSTDP